MRANGDDRRLHEQGAARGSAERFACDGEVEVDAKLEKSTLLLRFSYPDGFKRLK